MYELGCWHNLFKTRVWYTEGGASRGSALMTTFPREVRFQIIPSRFKELLNSYSFIEQIQQKLWNLLKLGYFLDFKSMYSFGKFWDCHSVTMQFLKIKAISLPLEFIKNKCYKGHIGHNMDREFLLLTISTMISLISFHSGNL